KIGTDAYPVLLEQSWDKSYVEDTADWLMRQKKGVPESAFHVVGKMLQEKNAKKRNTAHLFLDVFSAQTWTISAISTDSLHTAIKKKDFAELFLTSLAGEMSDIGSDHSSWRILDLLGSEAKQVTPALVQNLRQLTRARKEELAAVKTKGGEQN